MSSPHAQRDLGTLIEKMSPELDPREWVFVSVEPSFRWRDLTPRFVFHETEGVTIVIERALAETCALPYAFPSRCITLTVHSSLEAVGLLATVTRALADRGIAVNAVSAYYHDHLFIPSDRSQEALRVLAELRDTP